MPQKSGWFATVASLASGSYWRPTVPAGEVWLAQTLVLGPNTAIAASSPTGPSIPPSVIGTSSGSGDNQMRGHLGKPFVPFTPTAGVGLALFGQGGTGFFHIGGVCLDQATEKFTVKVVGVGPVTGAGTKQVVVGPPPVGKSWFFVGLACTGMTYLNFRDAANTFSSKLIDGPYIDTQACRTQKHMWIHDDSPLQVLECEAYSTYTGYATVVYLEFASTDVDEYLNRWSVSSSAASGSSYDIRPPSGESWSVDYVDIYSAGGPNLYFVDGAGTETLIPGWQSTGINTTYAGDGFRSYGNIILANDWYLRFKPGSASGNIRAQGTKDKL